MKLARIDVIVVVLVLSYFVVQSGFFKRFIASFEQYNENIKEDIVDSVPMCKSESVKNAMKKFTNEILGKRISGYRFVDLQLISEYAYDEEKDIRICTGERTIRIDSSYKAEPTYDKDYIYYYIKSKVEDDQKVFYFALKLDSEDWIMIENN